MRLKQLLVLLTLALVAAAGGVWRLWHDRQEQRASAAATGQLLLPGLPVNEVTTVTVTAPEATLTLHRPAGQWTVAERQDYPADFAAISRLLLALAEAKATQTVAAGPAHYARLKLADPGSGDGAGTRLGLRTEAGQEFTLILGKPLRDPEQAEADSLGGGWDARYVRLPTGAVAVLASDPGLRPAAPAAWLDPDFVKITDLRTARLEKAGQLQWELRQGKDGLELAGRQPAETADAAKLQTIANALAWIRFSDVLGRAGAAGVPVKEFPWRYTVTAVDGTTVAIAAAEHAGGWAATVAVGFTSPPVAESAPAATAAAKAGTPAEAKAKAAAEATATAATRAAELARKLDGWVFSFDKYAFENLLIPRDALLKKPEPAPAPPAAKP